MLLGVDVVVLILAVAVGVALLAIVSAFPVVEGALTLAFRVPFLYKIVVKVYGVFSPRIKKWFLRRVNPSLILGAIAVIVDPSSDGNDPRVLLGWHSYREHEGKAWALLGGALKRLDKEISDPAKAIVREVREETGLEIEVLKLLTLDTDLREKTMDFYFECALRDGPDLPPVLPTDEVTKLQWVRVSDLGNDVYEQHWKFLTGMLRSIPRLPGVSWSANQKKPQWWDRFWRAEQLRQKLLTSAIDPKSLLTTLAEEARDIFHCEFVGVFLANPAIKIISTEYGLPIDIPGCLELVTDSSELFGTRSTPGYFSLPLSRPGEPKLGLTAAVVRAKPLGHAIRLHAKWLHDHPHVRSWTGHKHLKHGVCENMLAVAVVCQDTVLGMLKAENKFRDDFNVPKPHWTPFEPDDGYVLEQLAVAAASLLGRINAAGPVSSMQLRQTDEVE